MPEAIISAESTEAPTARSGRFTYDRRKESFDVFREEFLQRLAEKYEYRADDKRRAWLALCDDEEAPLPDPPARKVAGYERMAAAIRGLAKETEEE